jgi:hypothetical protein
MRALQRAEKLAKRLALKGHGFSRADNCPKLNPASAAEGGFSNSRPSDGLYPQPVNTNKKPTRLAKYAKAPSSKVHTQLPGLASLSVFDEKL